MARTYYLLHKANFLVYFWDRTISILCMCVWSKCFVRKMVLCSERVCVLYPYCVHMGITEAVSNFPAGLIPHKVPFAFLMTHSVASHFCREHRCYLSQRVCFSHIFRHALFLNVLTLCLQFLKKNRLLWSGCRAVRNPLLKGRMETKGGKQKRSSGRVWHRLPG